MNDLLLTTNNGLEDIVADEFRQVADREGLAFESIDEEPFGLGGRILVRADEPAASLVPAARTMRSIHHVLHYIYEWEFSEQEPLADIESTLFEIDLPG